MSKIKLYNYFRSSTSYRARIALHYKQIPFTYIPVHLLKDGGEQYKADYEQKNPLKEVPTIEIDGQYIAQSLVILELLDQLYPNKPIYPQDIFLKSQIKQFCENINSFMHPLNNLKVLQYLEKNFQINDTEKEKWIHHWLKIGFDSLEKMVQSSHGKFCFGDHLSAADICLVPQIFTAKRFNFKIEDYPILNKINQNCLELEAFKLAHPLNQVDTPAELK